VSLLENEISKFEKRGFKIKQRRSLRHGKKLVLERRRKGLIGFIGAYDVVYIYFVDGDSNTRNITEFLKDYRRFFKDENLDKQDKGYFMVSGKFDKVAFRDLKKALIKEDKIMRTIRVKQLKTRVISERAKVEEEHIKEKIVEREITRRKITIEKVSVRKVFNAVKSIPFVSAKKERGYETQLYQWLVAKGFEVQHERLRRGARFDLVIGKDEIAVELKVIRSTSQFDRLMGQIMRYKNQFEKIIIVLIDELRNPSIMKQEIKRLKQIDPNILVVVK